MKKTLQAILIQLLALMLCLTISEQAWTLSFAEEIVEVEEIEIETAADTSEYEMLLGTSIYASRSVSGTHTEHVGGYIEVVGPRVCF